MRALIIFFVLFCFTNASAQTGSWAWIKSNNSVGYHIEIDNTNNIYLLSSLTNSATFGTNTLTSNGSADIVLSKNDSYGNVIWAFSFGGTGSENPTDITSDDNGDIYVTGFFSSPLLNLGSTTLINQGGTDVFVMKLNPDGIVEWATSISGTDNDKAYSIDVSSNGKVAITGSFTSSSIYYGSISYLNNSNSQDMFIAVLDDQGNEIWMKTGSGVDPCSGVSIAFDQSNNLFVSGVFLNYWMTIDNFTLTNHGVNDIFLLKIENNSDSILWVNQLGGGSSDYVNCMEVDNFGNVLLGGYFMSSTFQIGTTIHTNLGSWDMYLAKFDNDGNSIFSKSFAGNGDETIEDVHTDQYGNIYFIGKFSSSSIDFGSNVYTNQGFYDAVFLKLDINGEVIWSDRTNENGTENGFEISTDSNFGIYVIGSYTTPEINLGSLSATNIGNVSNGYFAKYDQPAGIEENKISTYEIQNFPNPFEYSSTFHFNPELINATAYLKNLIGETILIIKNISGNSYTLSNVDLPSGTYLISFQNDDLYLGSIRLIKK